MKIDPNVSSTLCSIKTESPIAEIQTYSFGVLGTILTLFGVIGNCLNLVIFLRSSIKSSVLIYVVAKTVTDLITVLFAVPWLSKFWKTYRTWEYYWWTFYMCYVELSIWNAFVGAGMLFMLIITVERFISLRNPLKFRVFLSNKRGYAMSLFIPLFSLICFIPHSFRTELVEFVDLDRDVLMFICCDSERLRFSSLFVVYIWGQQVVFRFIPVIFIFIFNMVMVVDYQEVKKRRRQMRTQSTNQNSNDPLTKMLLIFSFMFLACAVPSAILIAVNSDRWNSSIEFQIFRAIANVLEVISYSCPFYIYWISSKEFRRKLKKAIYINSPTVEPTVALVESRSNKPSKTH